ncbi:MAG: glycosyltransferase family 2 protein [Anaerolineales bacterium]|nr:glycosyltransferase family 2 protein [Anaerolineales bacterium]
MTNDLPLLTIGVLSWNRLHYLRATLESMRCCIQYPNIQWIVLDNLSTESGLADYLKSLGWVDDLIFMKSTHVGAMNEIVSRAKGEAILLWPDDMQFVVEGDWMKDCVEVLLGNHWIGSVSLNFQRRETVRRIWGRQRLDRAGLKEVWDEARRHKTGFRFPKKLSSTRGYPIRTYGWREDGIIGAGIASLTRTDLWKTLGPWKIDSRDHNIVDSSGGGEAEMLERWRNSDMPLQRAIPVLPVSADIITDSLGTKAKVRGDKRYGDYRSPTQGDFYYRIRKHEDVADLWKNDLPVAFEDFVEPVGFNLPLDEHGNLLKGGLNMSIVSSIV